MAASLQSLLLALDSAATTVGPNSTSRRPNLNLGRHAVRRRMQKRRRSLLEGSRTPMSRLEKRMRDLQKLVPAGESVGVDGIFSEAADYIACLRMQVEVMQVLVKVLTGDSEE